ncbi:transporter substrate-binding domain-containing protein [Alkalimonas collagenimarina]|uniref:Transporter substrate-binding domain-containing protein n=1 Tax=Alkalimonas collagenimarina TaxID=400390 RepID=A0ABT9GXK5_9GAMM|nr:transporter substrate-binding domain-containing protein [Alkalimonas collagenimarina]MDP4535791.1 transporter substrate-binding domain-containing protein [Alkalimonas collagenimarina]
MQSVVIAALIALVFFFNQASAKNLVRVGGYEFPPYIELEHGLAKGLTVELIRQLNQLQQEYVFELILTTPIRRHQDYQQGLFDAIFFEDIAWGWGQRDIAIDNSPAFAKDDEVFIALRSNASSQQWFDDLSGKTIAGILGYHYQLTNYETDPDILADTYRMTLVSNHQASVELVLKERTDSAIVTRSFLYQFLHAYPEKAAQLLISERVDQSYQHQLLIHPEHPLAIDTLYHWVQQLLQQEPLSKEFQRYKLELMPAQPSK